MKPKHGIRNTNSKFCRYLRMPAYFGDGPFNCVWVFENHDCFGRYSLRKVLRLLTAKIFFEKIDLVILADALLSARY